MTRAIAVAAIVLASGLVFAQDDATRAIVPEKFLKARPPASGAPAPSRPSYRPIARTKSATPLSGDAMEIGVTVWRLRPAKPGEPARLLIQEAASSTSWTPERVGAGTPLAIGDRVRLSVESPRAGYLYIVDREQYADGTTSAPYLVFPTSRTRGGENRVTGGRLVELPAQDDRPPFFTVKPSRPDQTGERLTLIITDKPLPGVTISDQAQELAPEQVKEWEARGSGDVEHLELTGGAGRAWSAVEQRAGADATRLLTQEDPPPQTLFRVQSRQPDFVVVNLTLPQARGRAK
jgi:hypothetical protein